MSRDRYEPSPLAEVEVRRAERSTLVFVRELPHPPEQVWSALTDPAQLGQWAPFDADRNLELLGQATLTMAGGGDEKLRCVVRRAERPRLLEYTWGNDLLRWQLEDTASGTRLTLFHTLEDPSFIGMVAPGWHICLDVMDRHLGGRPIGRIAGEEAKKHGWDRLRKQYVAALKLV